MKYPRRQQNSTSVYPTIKIMPAPQPSNMQCITEKRALTSSSTFVPSQRQREQMMRSMTGQAQMIKKIVLIEERLRQQIWQRLGSRSEQIRYKAEMISKGNIVLQTASLVLFIPLLHIIATIRVRVKQAAQQIQSLQKLLAQIVRTMSKARRISNSPKKHTNLRTLLYCFSIRWYPQTTSGPFQSTHEQTKDMATPTVSKGLLMLVAKRSVESLMLVLSVLRLTGLVFLQQQEACLWKTKQSIAHTPIQKPVATMKATQCRMYPPMVCCSSVSEEMCLELSCLQLSQRGSSRCWLQFCISISLARGLSSRQPLGWMVSPRLAYIFQK